MRHLAPALAAAIALCACGGAGQDTSAAKPALPVADVEGTPLPHVVRPVVVEAPARAGEDAAFGESAVAADSGDTSGRDAALRYMAGAEDAFATQAPTAAAPPAAPTPAEPALRTPDADPEPAVSPGTVAVAPAAGAPPPAAKPAAAPTPAMARVARDPNQARALNRQAVALINSGSAKRAIPALERAAALQPRDAEILGNLGYAYMLAGHHGRARTHLLTALEISPNRSATWLNLGETYAELGQREAAVEAVLKGYRYSPRKPAVRSALQRAARGERHSAAWRAAAGIALEQIGGQRQS